MPGRYLREESPYGQISFDEYQVLTRAISRKKGKPLEQSDRLLLPLASANRLFMRRITLDAGTWWANLLGIKITAVSNILSEITVLNRELAEVSLTPAGLVLLKSVERNAIGLNLLEHTFNAGSFREALLAELIMRFGKLSPTGERVVADIPLPSLRWWLGITGKYPHLKNIRLSIINRQNSPLNIEEVPGSATKEAITLACLPLDTPGSRLDIVERNNPAAMELAERSGEPLAAAISLIEDAKVLRPELNQTQVISLCCR